MSTARAFGYDITFDDAAGVTAKGSIVSLVMSSLLLTTEALLVALGSFLSAAWVLVGLYMFAQLELEEKRLSKDDD